MSIILHMHCTVQQEEGRTWESKLADTRFSVTYWHSMSPTQQVYPTTTSTIFKL